MEIIMKDDEPICCVQDMVNIALDLQEKEGGTIYFRGQEYIDDKGNKLQLLPTIGRPHYFVGQPLEYDIESERNLLHRFCRWTYLESKRVLGDWETLFLARSHGLPVRLLDWTSNPLGALYFAAKCEEVRGDAAVWAIVKKNENEIKEIDLLREEPKTTREEPKTTIEDDELYYQRADDLPTSCRNKIGNLSFKDLQNPLRLKGVRLLYPFYSSPRMIVQNCFFTIQDNPWSPLENYEGRNQEEYIEINKIFEWKVLKEYRWEIITQLERLGINNRTLFPDLDGLAKGLWQLEIVRKHSSLTDKQQ